MRRRPDFRPVGENVLPGTVSRFAPTPPLRAGFHWEPTPWDAIASRASSTEPGSRFCWPLPRLCSPAPQPPCSAAWPDSREDFIESLILAAADLFLSLPWLFLLLIARACLPLNVPPLLSIAITFTLLGLLGWAAPARVIRAAVRGLRSSEFVLFARASGCTPWRLLWAHVVPNVMPVLRAQFWTAVPVYILAETTLGMLGLGVSEPLPSWGGLLRELEGGDVASRLWLLAPALLLAAVTAGLQLIGPRKDLAI